MEGASDIAVNPTFELFQACRRGKLRTVKQIISNDMSIVHRKDPSTGRIALHYACANGEAACVQVLLAAGSKVDEVENSTHTPLHVVVLSSGMTEHKAAPPGFVKCAKSLLDAGAPVNARNAAGRRPVEVSAFCIGEMFELLEAAGGGYDADSDGVRSEAEDTVDAPQAANGGHNKPLNVAAAPAAPPRALQTPLGLPHPTVHATLCAELWDHATSSPDRTARKVLGILDEVLGDVCADNLEEEEYERLLGTAGSRIPGYVDALHNNRYLPGNLFDNLADVKQVANATALFQHSPQYGEIKLSTTLAQLLVALLSSVLLWATAGELQTPGIAGMLQLLTNLRL